MSDIDTGALVLVGLCVCVGLSGTSDIDTGTFVCINFCTCVGCAVWLLDDVTLAVGVAVDLPRPSLRGLSEGVIDISV